MLNKISSLSLFHNLNKLENPDLVNERNHNINNTNTNNILFIYKINKKKIKLTSHHYHRY